MIVMLTHSYYIPMALIGVLSACHGQTQPSGLTWKEGPQPAHDYAYHIAITDQQDIYVVGGLNAGAFERFDIEAQQWDTLSSLATPRVFPAGAYLDHALYVIGGLVERNTSVAIVEKYDFRARTWTRPAEISIARSRMPAVAFSGKLFVFGGIKEDSTGYQNLAIVETYDPESNAWTRLRDMPVGRHGHSAVVVGDNIFLMGGYTDAGETDLVSEYDPVTDTWKARSPMPTSRGFFGAVAIGDLIYTIAGRARSEYGPIEMYSVQTDTWTQLSPLPEWRNRFGIVTIDNVIYLIGGEDQPRSLLIGTFQ